MFRASSPAPAYRPADDIREPPPGRRFAPSRRAPLRAVQVQRPLGTTFRSSAARATPPRYSVSQDRCTRNAVSLQRFAAPSHVQCPLATTFRGTVARATPARYAVPLPRCIAPLTRNVAPLYPCTCTGHARPCTAASMEVYRSNETLHRCLDGPVSLTRDIAPLARNTAPLARNVATSLVWRRLSCLRPRGTGWKARATRRVSYSSIPAIVAVRKFASVPAIMARNPRRARSPRRVGASEPIPPI